MMLESAGNAQLCLTQDSAEFVAGTASLTIPCECAKRSILISELRQEADSDAELPLPLSLEELKAWLLCAGTASEEETGQRSDDDLLSAHKAAAFLRDEKTVAEVLDALAAVLAKALCDAHLEASKELRATTLVSKVIDSLPQLELLSVLSAIKQLPEPLQKTWPGYVNMLLHLVPRSHHPAIILACCVSEPHADHPMCTIRTNAEEFPAESHKPNRTENYYPFEPLRDIESTLPTTAFQLLAAAAPLAGGSLDLAWDANTLLDPRAAFENSSDGEDSCFGDVQQPAAKRMRPASHMAQGPTYGTKGLWQMSHNGCLRRLLLEFDVDETWNMPSRWCFALTQMITVRDLRIHLHGKDFDDHCFNFCAPDFKIALAHMPALEKLGVKFDLDRFKCRDTVTEFVFQQTLPLLDAVSQATSLTDLDLDGCINFHNGSLSDRAKLHVLTQLLRLSHLTSLRISMHLNKEYYVKIPLEIKPQREPLHMLPAFACAVRQLPALKMLHVNLKAPLFFSNHAINKAELVLELLNGPGLPALVDLNISMDIQGDSFVQPPLPFGAMHRCMRFHHEELAARLTSLTLGSQDVRPEFEPTSNNFTRCMVDEINRFHDIFTGMTALQSLSLASMVLLDGGLRNLTCVLPDMIALTHLSIGSVAASHTGVLMVLASLLEPGGVGHAVLRSLDLSGSCDLHWQQHAKEVARSLGQLRGLTHLGVAQMKLDVGGLREVATALKGLPQLRSVEAGGNVSCGDSDDEMVDHTAEAELQSIAALVPHADFKFWLPNA